ncbi:MAG: LytTR family DNA-binding domain-containing protein [Peptostreptococcaceae bacterium]|jgi:two-component system response regulator AgrA|nr:LytTR family DNA-binding domain-containing protein [Peptostreptococcaceae bacterium]
MFNFVICEDDETYRQKIIDIVQIYCKDNNISYDIVKAKNDKKSLINYVKEVSDRKNIYIFDIDLGKDKCGINFANEVRKYDKNGEIIFTTSHTKRVMEVFKYKLKVLDFIDKMNYMEENLIDAIKNAIKNSEEQEQFFYVESDNKKHKFHFDEIISFQTTSKNHKLKIKTFDDEVEFYGTLKEIECKLNSKFIRVHRAFIINEEHLDYKKSDLKNGKLVMKDDSKCLVSRNGIKLINKLRFIN